MQDLMLVGVCALCEGSGLKIIERPDGSRAVRDCQCRVEQRQARNLSRANLPALYRDKTLESFTTDHDDDEHTLSRARFACRKFVNSYPLETRGTGLLITGSVGTGKTHLAVGVLKALIMDRGATGMFCHYQELLKKVQNSYNRQVHATELEVLDPVCNVEVLVLDEVGATKPTDWVSDTVAHVLNTRYNERRTTIITTNYPNAEPLLSSETALSAFEQARSALRNETLGDRIGERMRSRLQEMCVVIEMRGMDFRKTVNRASFG